MNKVTWNQAAIDELVVKGIEETRKVGQDISETAKNLCPVKSGKLAASIHVAETEQGADVIADAPYALFVEMGTSKSRARPFLRPALDVVDGRQD